MSRPLGYATLAFAWAHGLLARQRGQTLAEYGIVLTVIAVGVIVPSVLIFRDTLAAAFNSAIPCLDGVC